MTSETMEYYLSNNATLVPFEPVSKNDMLVYLNVELLLYYINLCVCACVRACVRACVCACACVCLNS